MSRYNANVRVGNWFYDLILEEEKAKQYMRKTTTAELKIQKTRLAFLRMLKEIPLTFPVIGLSYGAVIQIVSPEMPRQTTFKLKEKQGIALGADIHFSKIEKRLDFADGDRVIGTGLLTPCVRNVWTLVPEDPTKGGQALRFGDTFYIKLCGNKEPLYLHSPPQFPSVPRGESGKVMPQLSAFVSSLTRFSVVNVDPKLRYETKGSVVPPFEKVAIIQSCNTESLAVEPETWFPTFYGMECEVSVHTYTYRGVPDPRNFWCFILASG